MTLFRFDAVFGEGVAGVDDEVGVLDQLGEVEGFVVGGDDDAVGLLGRFRSRFTT